MDTFLIDNLINKCPLTPRECAKKVVLDLRRLVAPPYVFRTGKKIGL